MFEIDLDARFRFLEEHPEVWLKDWWFSLSHAKRLAYYLWDLEPDPADLDFRPVTIRELVNQTGWSIISIRTNLELLELHGELVRVLGTAKAVGPGIAGVRLRGKPPLPVLVIWQAERETGFPGYRHRDRGRKPSERSHRNPQKQNQDYLFEHYLPESFRGLDFRTVG